MQRKKEGKLTVYGSMSTHVLGCFFGFKPNEQIRAHLKWSSPQDLYDLLLTQTDFSCMYL